jgi:outer membrane biosynthesis protein TonB
MSMADENAEQNKPQEESKKDTVRINLPPGLTGRGGPPSTTPPPAAKPQTPRPAGTPEEEAKKETAVMSRPAEVPRPKKDTSRVQVVAAKPIVAGADRPSIKLHREEEAAPAPAAAAPGAAAPGKGAKPAKPVAAGAALSGADAAMSIVAMVLSVVLAGYLAYIAFGG